MPTATITPKKARKTIRREQEVYAKSEFDKIVEHLAEIIEKHEPPANCVKRIVEALSQIDNIRKQLSGIIREDETPAQCVKRIVEALKERSEGCEGTVEAAANWGP